MNSFYKTIIKFINYLSNLWVKFNINNIIILFIVGFIFRFFINEYLDINVFHEYTHYISLFFYTSMASLIAFINELKGITRLFNLESLKPSNIKMAFNLILEYSQGNKMTIGNFPDENLKNKSLNKNNNVSYMDGSDINNEEGSSKINKGIPDSNTENRENDMLESVEQIKDIKKDDKYTDFMKEKTMDRLADNSLGKYLESKEDYIYIPLEVVEASVNLDNDKKVSIENNTESSKEKVSKLNEDKLLNNDIINKSDPTNQDID